jgi:hypothetical protein
MTRAVGLFALLTIAMTWPQARVIGTEATPHQDVYFNMWRLEWFAHAIATQPSHLFDAGIFHPEPDTLALSDAMIVESAAAAPLAWIGLPPVLVHNVLLLAAIALSGAAMFALARYLTGSRAAAIVAGIIFAFAPYRFEHIMHMELEWTMWMPLAFLALHRLYDTGRLAAGVALGGCLALQMLSSLYYGIFLAVLIPLAALLLLVRDRSVPVRALLAPLAAGAAIAIAASAPYARPYARMHAKTGDRPAAEVNEFSAVPASYLAVTPNNWLYRRESRREPRSAGPERRLFPGTIAVLLAVLGLVLARPSARPIVYLLLLVAAFEASLGFSGYSYRFLYHHVAVVRSLRALSRLGVFVLMFVALLSAYGYRLLVCGRSPLTRRTVLGIVALALLAEYRVTLTLVPYPNTPPEVYRVLGAQPRGVVLECPAPHVDALPGDDARYAYMSTFHWFPLVNGYSGVYPPSYLHRLERLSHFPDDTSIEQMRADGVQYVIVHASRYSGTELAQIRTRLGAAGMAELGTYSDGVAPATLFSGSPRSR